MNDKHSERARQALAILCLQDLALAPWALEAHHRDSDLGIAPAWTDGMAVYYGRDFEKFSTIEKLAVVAHEVVHIAFRHPRRGVQLHERLGERYNHKLFNIVIDSITNEMLRLAGYELPKNCFYLVDILDKFLGIKTTPEEALSVWESEALYMRLLQTKMSETGEKKKDKGNRNQQDQDSSDDDEDEGDQKGKTSPSSKKTNKKGKGKGTYDPTVAEAIEAWADENGYVGDIDQDASKKAQGSEQEEAMRDSTWAQAVAASFEKAQMSKKFPGKGIGKLGMKIADLPRTRTPWEKILRRLVNKAVTKEMAPSYKRPLRQFLGMDANARQFGGREPIFQPTWRPRDGMPRIVVGVDVSGSINNATLRKFAGEIASIGDKTGAELHIIVFDDGVRSYKKLKGEDFRREMREMEFHRGGGTSFIEVMEKAEELDPSIIIILTDLCGPYGPPPKTNVVWAIEEETPLMTPPFGRIISMAM